LYFGNRQTDEQMDSIDALSRSRFCEQQLNHRHCNTGVLQFPVYAGMHYHAVCKAVYIHTCPTELQSENASSWTSMRGYNQANCKNP